MNVLQEHYQELLKAKVEASGRTCADFKDVLNNLDALAKEQIKYGDEKTMWLDLSTKKMIARAIDPNCRIEIPANEIIRYKDTLAVTAYFYWSDSEHYVGRGFSRKSLTNLVSGDYDASKIETEFEALVMGAAATRALTDAGIGLEFYADGFEELFEQLEEKEAEEILDRKQEEMDKTIPEVPSQNEKKANARKRAAKKVEPAPATEPETTSSDDDELPFSSEESAMTEFTPSDAAMQAVEATNALFEEMKEAKKEAKETTAISLADAYKVTADIGQFVGQPLEAIYRARPLNLIWLVNSNAACKDAALVIINADEALKAKYNG